jgi:hypothetical protein
MWQQDAVRHKRGFFHRDAGWAWATAAFWGVLAAVFGQHQVITGA